MDLGQLRTNPQAQEDGVWVEIGEGASLLIGRMNNRKYAKKLTALLKPYERQVQMGTLADDKAEDLLAEAYSFGILLDWKGIEFEGKAVKYSRAKAKQLLLDPTLKDFRQLVEDLAGQQKLYRDEAIEEDTKN